MSTILQGLAIQGVSVKGERQFPFVPGLKLWLEYDQGITEGASGRLAAWKDFSDNNFNYVGPGGTVTNRRARIEDNSINFKSDTTILGSYTDNPVAFKLAFMAGGNKRGVYVIMKTKFNATDGNVAMEFRTGTQGAGSADSYRMRFFSQDRNVSYVVRNNGTNTSRSTANSVFSDDTNFLFRDILKTNNTSGNHKMYIDNTEVGSFTENHSAALTNAVLNQFQSQNNANNTDFKVKLLLYYDWNAYTDSEITQFDLDVVDIMRKSSKYSSIITW